MRTLTCSPCARKAIDLLIAFETIACGTIIDQSRSRGIEQQTREARDDGQRDEPERRP
jgi:hypothetical protein